MKLKDIEYMINDNAYVYAIPGKSGHPDFLDWDNDNGLWYNEDKSKNFTDAQLEELEILKINANKRLELVIMFKDMG